ncbi:hypothetical protein BDW75DRAFT_237517 [Aspergillus navahoensis]
MDLVFDDPVTLKPYIQDATDLAVSNIRLRVLDWVDSPRVHSPRAYELPIVKIADERPLLRVIFLKPKWLLNGLPLLIEHYKIPTAFLEGGIRAVTHSLGSLGAEDRFRCFFPFVCFYRS